MASIAKPVQMSNGVAAASAEDKLLAYFTTDDPELKALADTARAMKLGVAGNDSPVLISDAITPDPSDGGSLQWVQLVMQGGGMLGVAHIGFVYILELAGLRFLGLGGTSAGAINAGLIAAVRDNPADVSWDKTLKVMCDPGFSFGTFEDGPELFRTLRQRIVSMPPGTKPGFMQVLRYLFLAARNAGTLSKAWQAMGLHPGDAFHAWAKKTMDGFKVTDQAALDAKLRGLGRQGIKVLKRPISDPSELSAKVDAVGPDGDITKMLDAYLDEFYPLKLVTSEVGTQSKVVFPEDGHLFYPKKGDSWEAHPADYIRASMSVPIFFGPFELPPASAGGAGAAAALPGAGTPNNADWIKAVGFEGPVPQKAVFVDGGTLSNFPIDLFHRGTTEVPLLPTLGALLGTDRSQAGKIESPVDLLAAMNNSSRHLSDREFLLHNKDYNNLVAIVDTTPQKYKDAAGKEQEYKFFWLDFSMPQPEQRALFKRGAQCAVQFLENWRVKPGATPKWAAYKALRKQLKLSEDLEVTPL